MIDEAGTTRRLRNRMGDGAWRHRTLVVAAASTVVLTLGACGTRLSSQGVGAAPATTPPSNATGDTMPAAHPAPSTGGSNAGTPQQGTAGASNRGAAPPMPSSTTSTAPARSGLTPPTPGTYRYAQSGSTTIGGSTTPVPQQGTIVIDAPVPQGPQTWSQTWHSYVDPSQPPSDTSYTFTPDGVFVTSEVIRQTVDGQTVTFTCTFTPPVQEVPWPIRTGYSFTGSGDCQSFTVTLKGQITTTRQVAIDGQAVTVYVIAITATTSGNLTSSDSENQWFAPGLRLLAHDDTDETGNYGPFTFTSKVTRDLLSTQPG